MEALRFKKTFGVTYLVGKRLITQELQFIEFSPTGRFGIFKSPFELKNKIAVSCRIKKKKDGSVVTEMVNNFGLVPVMEYTYVEKMVGTIGIPLENIQRLEAKK